ncbi:MAG: glycosyltransferase family 4 protein [Bacteroidota bacterium]
MQHFSILQIANRIPWPLNDGGNIATYNVTRHLHRRGHRVVLVTLNTKKHYQDPELLDELSAVHATDIDTSLTAWGLLRGLWSAQPYNVERFRSEAFAESLVGVLQQEKFDIIQLEGSYLSMYLPLLRKYSAAPVLLRSHNVEYRIWQRLAKNTRHPIKRLYLKDLARKIRKFELHWLAQYDGVIAIADQDEATYRAAGFARHLRTINGGVDLATFRPSRPPEFAPRICFLGSLEWQPNVQGLHWFLNQVWPEVVRHHPEAQFHVAGKNPPPSLARLSAPGLTFHGMVPDAAEFLDAHHLFIVPLLSGGGMRLKIVEAMANGKCVLSTHIGAEGIACTHGKDIFLADRPAKWTAILRELLTSPEKSVAVARKGMELAAAKYSWEAIIAQFEAFYREVGA